MAVGERFRRFGLVLLGVLLVAPLPALASETHVYGDPGSGDFSVALAAAADASGNAYVMGAFYGVFQGKTSSGWDLWIARIADDGSFAWLQTWDAGIGSMNYPALGTYPGSAPWTETADYELLVDDSNRVRGRIGSISADLVSVDIDGTDPAYSLVSTGNMALPTLVPDGSGDVAGFLASGGGSFLGRVRPDGSEVWVSSVPGDYASPIVVTSEGTIVIGRRLPRLSFEKPAVAVTAADASGNLLWETTIYDACFLEDGNPLIDMGTEVGLVLSSGDCGSDDPEWVSTLSLQTGERLSHRAMKDTMNIIWCDDPRLGPITEAVPFGFVDGDECGGGDVFWTDVNNNLISEGSPTEGFSLAGMQVVNGTQADWSYGVLSSAPNGDRWNLDRFDYLGPASGLVPFDMVMTKNGAVVVGRAFNTAWIAASNSFLASAVGDLGAAVSVTVDVHAGRTFLPNGHTIGLVDPEQGLWHLYDNVGETRFYYGNPGDYPFMGDWDCNGSETPGLYRQSDGYVYLRNSNTQGNADIKFYFGNPGDVPIAGDFNADSCDTVSIYRPSNQRFYVINKLGSNDGGLGAAEFDYVFGNPGDKPFVGDFDGDGVETVGLHRESTGLVYFRNSHTQGNADSQFIFGNPGDRLVAGDWTGVGYFTPALFRPSNTTTYFRFTNTQGNADYQFTQGQSDWVPVAGNTHP